MKGKATLLGALLLLVGHARGQEAVVDAANVAQTVKAVAALERQLTELEATYRAMSGSRGLGTVFYDATLQEYLPGDWMRVYQAGSTKGNTGILGPLREVERAEALTGSVAAQTSSVQEREKTTGETNKAIALHAFDGAQARLAEVEKLMQEVNLTHDPKGAAEIQARIAAEQAVIENEGTKLALVSMLQRAEERLLEEQRAEVAAKLMDPASTGMPSCCSSP